MKPDVFARLAANAQAGDRKSLTALLWQAHTPVSFQCRMILRDEQAAQTLTRDILAAVPKQLAYVKDPADFEKWICRVTASRCMLALANLPREEREEDPVLPEAPASDMNEEQTAQLVAQLVALLPDGPRICLLLYSCAGLKLKGIAQITDYPESQILEYLNLAQSTINQQLRGYHKRGVHFTSIPALSSLLYTAMYASRDSKAAAMLASNVLPPKPAPVRRKFPVQKSLLIALAAAVVLLLVLLAVIVYMETSV